MPCHASQATPCQPSHAMPCRAMPRHAMPMPMPCVASPCLRCPPAPAPRTWHEHQRCSRAPEARGVDDFAPRRHAVAPAVDQPVPRPAWRAAGQGRGGASLPLANATPRGHPMCSAQRRRRPASPPAHAGRRSACEKGAEAPTAGVGGAKHQEVRQRLDGAHGRQVGMQHLLGVGGGAAGRCGHAGRDVPAAVASHMPEGRGMRANGCRRGGRGLPCRACVGA